MKTASQARDNESKPMLGWEATNELIERRLPLPPMTGGKPAMKQMIRWIQFPVIPVQLAK